MKIIQDDIKLNVGSQCGQSQPVKYFCDFEADVCDFGFDPMGEMSWERFQGRISMGGYTGPMIDHSVSFNSTFLNHILIIINQQKINTGLFLDIEY